MSQVRDITLIEVGTRDGFQSESKPVPTKLKLEMVNRLQSAGLAAMQITSFVHPKWVPQMADADALCEQLGTELSHNFSALTLNERGVVRAQSAGIKQVDMSMSASNTHSLKNANKNPQRDREKG